MTEPYKWSSKPYGDAPFMNSSKARPLRIAAEYLEPEERFEKFDIDDTIVFFGSARLVSREQAEAALEKAKNEGGNIKAAENSLAMSRYYEEARELAGRLSEWSKNLENSRRRFVVCTGGGPGIMEAANRGASEAKSINIGLNIAIPNEQHENTYITRELSFEFNYFFMRKFWFIYLAKALVVFPGGYGTMDEFFEAMTLIQTRKLGKNIPIILYGKTFWDEVINFDAMLEFGTIEAKDLNLFTEVDSVDEAFDIITQDLESRALNKPGGAL
jgi:uncharacterized protein (TIGR00730 family)